MSGADEWDRLWAPFRMAYIEGENKPTHGDAGDECPFCRSPQDGENDSLVVVRGEHAYVLLNRYPYNSGHVLVCPYRHVADYTELTTGETDELSRLTQASIATLRLVSRPQAFNVGMNLGTVAGAGIAAHLHQHVVPRWGGDTNFMPVVGATKVLPQLLHESRDLLRKAWVDA
jgi:ATP adenylyltransferase